MFLRQYSQVLFTCIRHKHFKVYSRTKINSKIQKMLTPKRQPVQSNKRSKEFGSQGKITRANLSQARSKVAATLQDQVTEILSSGGFNTTVSSLEVNKVEMNEDLRQAEVHVDTLYVSEDSQKVQEELDKALPHVQDYLNKWLGGEAPAIRFVIKSSMLENETQMQLDKLSEEIEKEMAHHDGDDIDNDGKYWLPRLKVVDNVYGVERGEILEKLRSSPGDSMSKFGAYDRSGFEDLFRK